MSLATQAKALRLLQQQQFEQVGGNAAIQTNVRIIAATNRDLRQMVAANRFRQDLYYRLSGFTVHLPPLRARLDDLPLLTDHLIHVHSQELNRPIRFITAEARAAIRRHGWPGNVRELRNAIRYAILQSSGEVITLNCLPEELRSSATPVLDPQATGSEAEVGPDIRCLVEQLLSENSHDIYRRVGQLSDKIVLDLVLQHTHGNQVQAAERLGISRATLRVKLRALYGELGEGEPAREDAAKGEVRRGEAGRGETVRGEFGRGASIGDDPDDEASARGELGD